MVMVRRDSATGTVEASEEVIRTGIQQVQRGFIGQGRFRRKWTMRHDVILFQNRTR